VSVEEKSDVVCAENHIHIWFFECYRVILFANLNKTLQFAQVSLWISQHSNLLFSHVFSESRTILNRKMISNIWSIESPLYRSKIPADTKSTSCIVGQVDSSRRMYATCRHTVTSHFWHVKYELVESLWCESNSFSNLEIFWISSHSSVCVCEFEMASETLACASIVEKRMERSSSISKEKKKTKTEANCGNSSSFHYIERMFIWKSRCVCNFSFSTWRSISYSERLATIVLYVSKYYRIIDCRSMRSSKQVFWYVESKRKSIHQSSEQLDGNLPRRASRSIEVEFDVLQFVSTSSSQTVSDFNF